MAPLAEGRRDVALAITRPGNLGAAAAVKIKELTGLQATGTSRRCPCTIPARPLAAPGCVCPVTGPDRAAAAVRYSRAAAFSTVDIDLARLPGTTRFPFLLNTLQYNIDRTLVERAMARAVRPGFPAEGPIRR